MDRQPTDGGLRLGANPSRSDPRSGCLLRQLIRSSRSLARHSRSSDVCTPALAERVCGTPDRLDPPGMPGPHRGDRRAASAPYPQMLHGVLQRGAHASIVKQGCAHLEGHPVRRAHRNAACAWWTAPSVHADLICGRDRHRSSGFKAFWRWKSRHRAGRPKIDRELRDLIRRMSKENPLWGASRIHGELLMLGFEVARSRNTWCDL